jgi:hypothetical protein
MASEFIPTPPSYAFAPAGEAPADRAGPNIEQLFNERTQILKTKLEVFASEILDRLRIRQQNLAAIDSAFERVGQLTADVTRQADYLLRDRRDIFSVQQLGFDLERQKREEDVSCWRDTADVMKDFLEVWEALAQARARSVFLSRYG